LLPLKTREPDSTHTHEKMKATEEKMEGRKEMFHAMPSKRQKETGRKM